MAIGEVNLYILWNTSLDSIAVSVFVVILVDLDKYWVWDEQAFLHKFGIWSLTTRTLKVISFLYFSKEQLRNYGFSGNSVEFSNAMKAFWMSAYMWAVLGVGPCGISRFGASTSERNRAEMFSFKWSRPQNKINIIWPFDSSFTVHKSCDDISNDIQLKKVANKEKVNFGFRLHSTHPIAAKARSSRQCDIADVRWSGCWNRPEPKLSDHHPHISNPYHRQHFYENYRWHPDLEEYWSIWEIWGVRNWLQGALYFQNI